MQQLVEEEKATSLYHMLVCISCSCEVQKEVSCTIIKQGKWTFFNETLLVQIEYLSETL